MVKKWHVSISFKWFDLWIGFFLDRPGKALYICLLPMLPIKIWFTEHKRCPVCEMPMQKVAMNSGEGWILDWECKDCGYVTEGEYDWPFGGELLSAKDLEHRGFEVV